MEVKDGYKQTEIGIIPKDWIVKSISEFSKPVRGGSPRPAGDPKFFNGNFIPWLTVAALTNIPLSRIYVTETEKCLTEEGSLHSRLLEKETLIIANSGATLGVAKILAIKCCANDGIAALIDFNKEISKIYLVYFINTQINYLREVVATGNGQPNLNTRLIGNLKVPLPPTIIEQQAIAEILSDIDNLVQSLENLTAKKHLIKRGLMQKLLVQNPQIDWNEKKLGEIGDCFAGGTPSTFNSKYWNGDIIWLPSGRIQNNILQKLDDEITITQIGLKESAAKLIKPKSVLIAITGATCGNIGLLEFKAAANQSVIAIEPNEKVDYRFLYYSLLMKRNDILKNQTGSAQGGVNLYSLKKIKVLFPSFEKQTHIATVISNIDLEIEKLEQKLSKYKSLKKGLVQNLLTGKIRLKQT